MIAKLSKHPLFIILTLFIAWRIFLTLAGVFAVSNVPLMNKDRFLGGGSQNYHLEPLFFSWANFDGEHYLSISIHGYKFLEQAFFPVYPTLISFFAKPFYNDLFSANVFSILAGLLTSNIAFFFALVILWELIRIDYSQNLAYLTIILLLIFPTSFYFGALYNESLFLLFSVLSFYTFRKGMLLKSSFLGALSSATRVFGIILFPAFLVEIWQQKMYRKIIFWLFFIPVGLGMYMLYQYFTFDDPLAFYNLQTIVGEQHTAGITLLPQVYFRYIKMLLTVDMQNPIYQTILLEFSLGIIFFLLPIYGFFKKIRLSYLIYAMVGFLLPTIQGSFSSTPRYIIVFFPSFLAAAIWLNSKPNILKVIILSVSIILLFIESVLFLRGYWVA
ncbi:MAG: mannosyltransferase family protein [Patescibacteria group bacterium]